MMTSQYKYFLLLRTHKLHHDDNCIVSELSFAQSRLNTKEKKAAQG